MAREWLEKGQRMTRECPGNGHRIWETEYEKVKAREWLENGQRMIRERP